MFTSHIWVQVLCQVLEIVVEKTITILALWNLEHTVHKSRNLIFVTKEKLEDIMEKWTLAQSNGVRKISAKEKILMES